jgi:PPK2 family polyphosphate:nucleotide phosphotransferase
VKELLVEPGRRFRWSDHDPRSKLGFDDRADAEKKLADDVDKLIELQDVFAANGSYGLLIVLQGVDAAGKDGIVRHVMSGLNPQGVRVYPFRAPSPEERAHDYLWRAEREVPERGRIAIFNRSYYEDVLIVRVHPELLEGQRLPQHVVNGDIWRDRFRQINNFEQYLVENGILVLKFFLNVSREEQLKRLLERIDEPDKNWKFSPSDLEVPQQWDAYRSAYEEMLSRTSTAHAPWFAIPADRKWVARLAVADVVAERLAALELSYPRTAPADRKRLDDAKTFIERELGKG